VTTIRISFLKIFKIISPDQVNAVARWSVPSRIESPLNKGNELGIGTEGNTSLCIDFQTQPQVVSLVAQPHHLQAQEGVILPTFIRVSDASTREISAVPIFW
jgi:hypothetical protein